ncbi:plasmid mobilization relaxosome protein MobC [Lachnospiraceae bacterium PAL227]|uniref:Plasmid mobilization relaxosome protein MobC n=2 Tax=Ohessyouella blattaphilus TaxID=2949333 RepID=A0ABT1EG76_9FIRM|nr:plasmid mobilization relaxosome protein MobC [Ohessyouella blattaphilus]MCP1109710.1 plasmid mobilization relaxosome protein MobC [Ohessyouella blattaphilus]MCR8563104.1 plasmid mobilization relaxosome protein MobC [Ohessyouella blattaphilus]
MVTEHERDLIEQKMEQAGVRNMGAYIRKQAIDGFVIRLDLSDVREMVRLLRITSNNMNQIAKRANETRSIYEADIADLQARYDELWNQAADILRALTELRR